MSNLREFSVCGSSVSAVSQIDDLYYDEDKESIVSVKVMHSANLKSMQVYEITRFQNPHQSKGPATFPRAFGTDTLRQFY